MSDVEYSVTINRPVYDVFRYATNIENAQKWQPDVKEVHRTNDNLRVGTMITQVRSTRLLRWRLDLNADITEFQSNKVVEYKGVLGVFPVVGRIKFESSGRTCTVTESLDIRMGCLYSPFSPLMRGTMSRRTKRALETLKTQMENSGSSAPTNFQNM